MVLMERCLKRWMVYIMTLDHVSCRSCIMYQDWCHVYFLFLIIGMKVGINEINIVLYADDIVLLSDSPETLKICLDCFKYGTCTK